MLKLWCLLLFHKQIILKWFLLLIVTYTTKYFNFFTKIYHCLSFAIPLKEVEGSGSMLGCRLMQQKLRIVHDIEISR